LFLYPYLAHLSQDLFLHHLHLYPCLDPFHALFLFLHLLE
jgi:hypothetical protein